VTAPPVIYTHYSNRTEDLVQQLVRVVALPVGGPFCSESIVVQGQGMAAYLTQKLASAFGVWAHGDFSFPRKYTQRCVDAVLGGHKGSSELSEEQLTWLVLAELDRSLEDVCFRRLQHYLKNDERGVKRFQLARRLGTLFDRYVTYRPDMVRAWSRGESGDVNEANLWQPELWRRIEPALQGRHFAAVESDWHTRARNIQQRPAGLPPRVCIFGISSLPPPYLRLLAACSRWVQTHVFVFSPSDKDWWNSNSKVQWAQLVKEGKDPSEAYVDLGHPLIMSCGAVGADFRRVMGDSIERMQLSEAGSETFSAPPNETLLGRLQSSIFDVAPKSNQSEPPFQADDSIAIHACHSPMREVEVCRDQLLALMTRANDPIAPHEVVVMMADVETYAPFVEAVFGERPGSPTHIPFRIADRKLRADSPVVDAFFRALDLVGSRLTASTVIDLLTASAIEERLGLDTLAVEQVTEWITAAGVRWGLDAVHRGNQGQPENNQNTWRFGLDRLVLGYAMPTGGQAMFADVLPYDEIEGKQAADLGVVASFLDSLFFHVRQLEAPRTVSRWRSDLLEFLNALVGEGHESDWQQQYLRQALADLERDASSAGFAGDVDLSVLRSLLEERVESAMPERGFLAGGITFCAMVPMRSIPFRVVCLLGLNDGSFPRPTRTTEFDLLAHGPGGPQPGDRDRRMDDRYLFLETLCAARDYLLITYTGQSIRDNGVRPPSVLVSEVIDCLSETTATRDTVENALVLRHPLQPFSRRYFTGEDSRLFSYGRSFQQSAETLEQELSSAPLFVQEVLSASDVQDVSLSDLARFWSDPLASFLKRRLRIDFSQEKHSMPDREPIELDGLKVYGVGDQLLTTMVEAPGTPRDAAFQIARATGELPFGSVGEFYLEDAYDLAERIASSASSFMSSPCAPVHFDQRLSGSIRLHGTLDGLYADGGVFVQYNEVSAKRQMSAWVVHLILCLVAPKNVLLESILVGRGAKNDVHIARFATVKDPLPLVEDLVALFQLGQRAPLRFQPHASMAFIQCEKGDPMKAANTAFTASKRHSSLWSRVAPGESPPFDTVVTAGPAFDLLAKRVMGPLVAHMTVQVVK
jgi:exodeoxyribonuclease V gamma subunit